MRWFPAVYLFVNGIAYCVLGWLFASNPVAWFESLQIVPVDPVGYTELQTTYIGLMSGMGLFLLAASVTEPLLLGGVLVTALTYFGLVVVRGWGIFLTGVYNELMLQLFIVESIDLLAGGLALYCLYRMARRKRNPYF